MVADNLAIGCLLAQVSDWLEGQAWYLQLFRPLPSLGLLVLLLGLNGNLGYTVVAVFGTSIINLSIAILVHRSVYCYQDRLGRFLNWGPVAYVGLMSYSLYIWQQPFLKRQSVAWVNVFPQNLILAMATAFASYYLLEKPFLKLRHRFRA